MLYWVFLIYLAISLPAFVLLMAILYVGRGDPLPPEPLGCGHGVHEPQWSHEETDELQLH